MVAPYIDQEQFPESVDVPDNSDLPSADDFDVPIEAALDRTRWLKNRVGSLAAKAWFPPVVQTHALLAAAWDPAGAQWWAVAPGINDTMCSSVDRGATWQVVVPGASGIKLQSIAVDQAANIVAVGNSSDIYEFNHSTSTWTHRIGVFAAPTLSEVAFEPVNGLWVAYENTGFQFMKVHTSPDRATWTDQSAHLPAPLSGDGVTTAQPHLGVGGGRVVIAVILTGGTVHVSSCAGVDPTTWTAAALITPAAGATLQSCSDPVYIKQKGSASFGTWLIALKGLKAATPCTEIWKSVDGGTTWTRAVTLGGTSSSIKIVQLAAIDPLVCGITSDGYAIFSVDGGTTWYVAQQLGPGGATARAIWAGNGGFLEFDTGGTSDHVVTSVPAGKDNAIAVGL
jgi:hypothetical protein